MVKVHFCSLAQNYRLASFYLHENPNFKKSEKNGEKRRKPEKISGFLLGIFFVKTHWRRHPDSDRG